MKDSIEIIRATNGFAILINNDLQLCFPTKQATINYISKWINNKSKPEILKEEQLEEREKKYQAILKFKGLKKGDKLYSFREVQEELKKQGIEVSPQNIKWVFTRR